MTKRHEFTAGTIAKRFAHCKGRCEWEGCGMLLRGRADYEADHDKTAAEGGNNSFENCRILCHYHHAIKTNKMDKPRLAKGTRQSKAHAGIRKKSRFATSRSGDWKSLVGGKIVRRNDDD